MTGGFSSTPWASIATGPRSSKRSTRFRTLDSTDDCRRARQNALQRTLSQATTEIEMALPTFNSGRCPVRSRHGLDSPTTVEDTIHLLGATANLDRREDRFSAKARARTFNRSK